MRTPPARGGWLLGVAVALAATGCVQEMTPVVRADLDRVQADLGRVEQRLQKSQADLRTELQQVDRRSAQTLAEVQRSVARLGARLDDLAREAGQVQGRLDEIRRRVETLGLQIEAGGPPAVAPPPGRLGPAPGRPPEPVAPPAAPPAAAGPPARPAAQAADLYQTAYIDYTRGNYHLAIAAFREFIRLYPQTELAEKAQYWIAESHFSLARSLQAKGERERATQELERAVQQFRRVAAIYPRGDRVPAALYKEALALLDLGQRALAEARLQFVVDQFPATEEGAKAKDELAKLRPR